MIRAISSQSCDNNRFHVSAMFPGKPFGDRNYWAKTARVLKLRLSALMCQLVDSKVIECDSCVRTTTVVLSFEPPCPCTSLQRSKTTQ